LTSVSRNPRGKWQHVTYDLSLVDDDFLTNGTMFDGFVDRWLGKRSMNPT